MDLADLKVQIYKLDVNKQKTVSVDVSKLSNIADNVVNENKHDKLVMKINASDTKLPSTSELVAKTQYNSDKQNLEKKIEDVDKNVHNTSGLVKDWLQYKNYRNWKQNTR